MQWSHTTRISLLARLANHQDTVAWGEFLDLYQPLIYRFALSRGLQDVDATEVTQEVLVRVSQALQSYQPRQCDASFRRWLYTLTRNLTIDFLRKENRRRDHQVANWEEVPAADPEPSGAFLQAYQQELFLAAARQIQPQVKPQNWEAFWRTEIQRQDAEHVGKELSMDRAAVYVARSRILKKFRQYIERHRPSALNGEDQE